MGSGNAKCNKCGGFLIYCVDRNTGTPVCMKDKNYIWTHPNGFEVTAPVIPENWEWEDPVEACPIQTPGGGVMEACKRCGNVHPHMINSKWCDDHLNSGARIAALEAQRDEANGLLDEVDKVSFGYDEYHHSYVLAEKIRRVLSKRREVE